MPRRKLLIRPRRLTLKLPGDLYEKLEKFLTSDRTGVVPMGAWQSFFVNRSEEFFAKLESTGNAFLKEIENDQP